MTPGPDYALWTWPHNGSMKTERVLITMMETTTHRLVGQWIVPVGTLPASYGVEIPATSDSMEAYQRPYTMVVQRFTAEVPPVG